MTWTHLDSLGKQLVAGVRISLEEGHTEGHGSSEGEVRSSLSGGGVGVAQFSTQFQTSYLGDKLASTHLDVTTVVGDHLLFLFLGVVDNGEFGSVMKKIIQNNIFERM